MVKANFALLGALVVIAIFVLVTGDRRAREPADEGARAEGKILPSTRPPGAGSPGVRRNPGPVAPGARPAKSVDEAGEACGMYRAKGCARSRPEQAAGSRCGTPSTGSAPVPEPDDMKAEHCK